MSPSIMELTATIVASHASMSELSTEELLGEIQKVYSSLKQLESGETEILAEVTKAPSISLKKAFQADQVICMICGKGGMKTLARHLAQSHGLKPGEYRKQFGIPSSQSLTAKNFSEERRKMAQEKGLATNLAKARAVRAAKLASKGSTPKSANKTTPKTAKVKTVKVKAPVKKAV